MQRIDVRKAIKSKYKGYIPGFIYKGIEKLIHQDELNEMAQMQDEVDGVSMADKVANYLDITIEDIYPYGQPPKDKPLLFVSNHPLGGADGMVLTSLIGNMYDGKIKFFVNDLLMQISQFGDVFVPVNKYGAQGRDQANKMSEVVMDTTHHIITFPAGLCSRLNDKGEIRDLEWKLSFIKMARRSGRTIVPIFVDAENSKRFYRIARARKKLKLKFNYELVLLPDEMMRAKHKKIKVYFGKPIAPEDLPSTPLEDRLLAKKIYDEIYTYPNINLNVKH